MHSSIKQIFFCTLGTALEWYEFSIFACLTPILVEIFFSNHSRSMGITFVFLTFASGYLMRPLGAIFFGHFGDRLGRKKALLITLIIMTFATAGIGFIPQNFSYASILMVVCRLLQGFASSGEYPGGITILAEQPKKTYPTFIASFGIFSAIVGIFFGTFFCTLLFVFFDDAMIVEWGWRIPFLTALPLGLLGYLIRRSLSESFEFDSLKNNLGIITLPIKRLFKLFYKELFVVTGLYFLSNITFYINFIFISNYVYRLKYIEVMLINLITTLTYGLFIILSAILADRYGKIRIMFMGCLFIALLIFPLYYVVIEFSIIFKILSQILISVLLGFYVGPLALVSARCFPVEVRYTGTAVALNTAAICGGVSPVICIYLSKWADDQFMPSYFLIAIAILSCFFMQHKIIHKSI